jgi:hypothetical protein
LYFVIISSREEHHVKLGRPIRTPGWKGHSRYHYEAKNNHIYYYPNTDTCKSLLAFHPFILWEDIP